MSYTLWALDDSRRLLKKHKTLIENPSNDIYVSFYSLMEISIKRSLGKLPDFKASIGEILSQIDSSGFTLINCRDSQLIEYEKLPLFSDHRDPFDRFILATAIAEKLPILTCDKKFRLYRKAVRLI